MDFVEDVRMVLSRLDAERVPHMLVGGLALDALGVPRATVDVDIQVSLPTPPRASEPSFMGLVVEERARDAVFGQDVIIAHRPTSGVPFEFFLTTHWLCQKALAAAVRVRSALLTRDVPVPTPEDFILLKSAYHASPSRRAAKRAQDAVDIQSVLDTSGASVDLARIEEDARKLGTWLLLEPIIRDAGR